jgi:hypothetical protein
MFLGAFVAACCAVISIFSPSLDVSILMFGGGALFGKGYGIWEIRALKDTEERKP